MVLLIGVFYLASITSTERENISKLEQILQDMGMVVEGVKTTKATMELAQELHISMPITEMMYRVLFEDFPVQQAVSELMCRNKKSELEMEMLGV